MEIPTGSPPAIAAACCSVPIALLPFVACGERVWSTPRGLKQAPPAAILLMWRGGGSTRAAPETAGPAAPHRPPPRPPAGARFFCRRAPAPRPVGAQDPFLPVSPPPGWG